MRKKNKMGFKQAIEYVLSVLCYAYYVKHDSLIDDQSFDQLEKVYCKLFKTKTAPNRAMEREECYTNGVKVVYDEIRRKRNAQSIQN